MTARHRRFFALAGLLVACLVATPALAQDDLDDIFGSDDTVPQTAGEERASLLSDTEEEPAPTEKNEKKRIIQTLQRKNFMKIGRYEAGPHLGFVTNDPFINRYLLGGSFAYHITEIFAIEGSGTFSPDLKEGDYKPVTDQIINENQVTPDISKIYFFTNLTFQYSPIYGKVAMLGNNIITFDIFGLFGTGIVNTRDDLIALQNTTEVATATESQIHPTLNYGGGIRVIFSKSFAIRVETRGLSYIEVLESSTLEMKNNMTLLATASFFFPEMR